MCYSVSSQLFQNLILAQSIFLVFIALRYFIYLCHELIAKYPYSCWPEKWYFLRKSSEKLVGQILWRYEVAYFWWLLSSIGKARSPKTETFWPFNTAPIQIYDNLKIIPHYNRCLLFFISANNWGICENGNGKLGCGPQEYFRGCADVKIE